ncbi:hypothetical protein [Nevskia soli]|uniref:hypothetical protein n=1 Tax=Nevskia soli TaxID=418856 RepID=UPI00068AE1CB|nr:hypothetical protein [Nevskia soli]
MARTLKVEGGVKKGRVRGGRARVVGVDDVWADEVGPAISSAVVAADDAGVEMVGDVGDHADLPADEAAARLAVVEPGGLSPLAYLLRVMRDERETPARRMDAAKTAAPFLHPKLATMDVQSAGLDRMGDALVGLIERAQADGGGVGGLLGR